MSTVIDTATNTVEATVITVGTVPGGVAITPDGKHAYVMNFVSNTVSVIDTASNTVVGTHGPGGDYPRCGRRHPGRETRLCHEYWLQQCFGDRHGHATRWWATDPGGECAPRRGHHSAAARRPLPRLQRHASQIDLDRKPNEDSFDLQVPASP